MAGLELELKFSLGVVEAVDADMWPWVRRSRSRVPPADIRIEVEMDIRVRLEVVKQVWIFLEVVMRAT